MSEAAIASPFLMAPLPATGAAGGNQPLNFESLIAPLFSERFFAEYWRRRTLYVRHTSPQFFDPLCGLADIDQLLIAALDRPEDWQFFRSGEVVESSRFSNGRGQVLLAKVFDLYRGGGTIHLARMECHLPAVRTLHRAMVQRFRTRVHVNLWATRGNTFAPFLHFDNHDLLILQIHGRKNWTLYDLDPTLFAPNSVNAEIDRRDVGEPSHRITMEPGDMLYVPAGQPHEVTTVDVDSVHLAVGVYPILWRDVLGAALADVDLRGGPLAEAVPFDALTAGDGELLLSTFCDRLLKAADTVEGDALALRLAEYFSDLLPRDEAAFEHELKAAQYP